MTKKYDYTVFIGRFQPFHNGHKKVVETALQKSKKLIIVVGGKDKPPSTRNPFNHEMVELFIRANFSDEQNSNIIIDSVFDYPYNDIKWVSSVQSRVGSRVSWTSGSHKIALIGHAKDHTSYYLKMFPGWGSIAVENYEGLSSTNIREYLFEFGNNFRVVEKITSNGFSAASLKIFQEEYAYSEQHTHICNEAQFIEDHNEMWKDAPYPPTFQTCDSVVTCAGYILLIKRKDAPGKNQWAIPGGYLNVEETLLQSTIRELQEETKIDIPEKVLRGSIKKIKTFDAVNRSERGRIITQCYHFEINPDNGKMIRLPKVSGADDASEAKWFEIKDFIKMRNQMFEDHYDIISEMLNI